MGHKLKIAGWVSVGVVAGALTTVSLQTVARGAMTPLPLEEIQQLSAVFGLVKTDYVEPVDDKKLITDAISGMVSSLADALALGQLSLASSTLISIACFVLGSACCALCVQWARRRVRHEYALALLIQAVLMLLFGLLAGRVAPGVSLTLHMTAWSLCLMMGWQNAMITKLSHAEIRTTHVTGLLTDIGIGLGRWLGPAQDRLTRRRARRKLAVQAAMFDPFEYLLARHKDGLLKTDFKRDLGKVSYHIPCHGRVQNIGKKTEEMLKMVPATWVQTNERCSVKTIAKKVDGSDVIPTVINLWKVADLLEREVFDFVGIKFAVLVGVEADEGGSVDHRRGRDLRVNQRSAEGQEAGGRTDQGEQPGGEFCGVFHGLKFRSRATADD